MLRKAGIIGVALWLATSAVASQTSGIWLDVPFVRQEKNACGAASLAMVLQYWSKQKRADPGSTADPVAIQRVLYSASARGIYAVDMARYLEDHGFRAFVFRGDWEDLKQHLGKGRPLIVALGGSRGSPLHYVVVAGIDWAQDLVLVNDPAQRKLLKQSRRSFERQWSATDRWTLLAVPQ